MNFEISVYSKYPGIFHIMVSSVTINMSASRFLVWRCYQINIKYSDYQSINQQYTYEDGFPIYLKKQQHQASGWPPTKRGISPPLNWIPWDAPPAAFYCINFYILPTPLWRHNFRRKARWGQNSKRYTLQSTSLLCMMCVLYENNDNSHCIYIVK